MIGSLMGGDRTSFEKKSRATRRGRARTVAVLKGVVILLLLFTLPALWSWTALNDRINLATVIEWLVEDGDPVSAGQPLVRLHPAE